MRTRSRFARTRSTAYACAVGVYGDALWARVHYQLRYNRRLYFRGCSYGKRTHLG
jgi:hypothetical protein